MRRGDEGGVVGWEEGGVVGWKEGGRGEGWGFRFIISWYL